MKRLIEWGKVLIVGAFILTLAACGLPSELKDRAAKVKSDIASLSASLEQRRTEYETVQQNADAWTFFAPYAERENWEGVFTAVASDLENLTAQYDSKVEPVLKKDDEETAATLTQLLEGIEGNFDPVRVRIREVDDRMTLLLAGYQNADQWIQQSRDLTASIDAVVDALQPVIAKTKTDFSSRTADIDTRYAPMSKMQSDAHDALSRAEAEFAKHQSGAEADYAIFADAAELIKSMSSNAAEFDTLYREDIASLYADYTTILRDMKVEYVVQVSRATWDNNSDWDNSADVTYDPVTISQTDYEYLMGLGAGEGRGEQGYLARVSHSWGGKEVESFIDSAVWARIAVPTMADLPYGDNDGQFWIEDLYPTYFHKVAEVSGTTVTEGDWEEVDEVDYAMHVDDFGLATESKPVGKFADEAVLEATPPGMEMVGNEHYGEWRQDTSGNSFWHYYGQFAFFNALLGGNNHNYYQSDYNNYRSWREERRTGGGVYGWYGSNRTTPTYGSSGSYTTQTASYKSSPFAQSGGSRSVTPNLRSAGETARSRGPGGGGK